MLNKPKNTKEENDPAADSPQSEQLIAPSDRSSAPQQAAGDLLPETSPHNTESFARKTSDGAVGDISALDDQAVLAGLKAECEKILAIDANYPGRYHRLGTFIAESNKRLGEDAVRQMLRAEGISRTTAHWAVRIVELYTYEQTVQFPSLRAILKTLPKTQPRKPKPKKDITGGGDHRATTPHEPRPTVNDENILDRFIQLGIEVRELFGAEALDQAVEQIRNHTSETFEDAFAEVGG